VPRLRVLLVEPDPALQRVVGRELGRYHTVLEAPSIARAIDLLTRDDRIQVLVSAYALDGATAAKLFGIAARRWPRVRRILYTDRAPLRAPMQRLAQGVVDPAAPFEELLNAIATAPAPGRAPTSSRGSTDR
jgi:DNA-binding NtrC family response regulator